MRMLCVYSDCQSELSLICDYLLELNVSKHCLFWTESGSVHPQCTSFCLAYQRWLVRCTSQTLLKGSCIFALLAVHKQMLPAERMTGSDLG